jgi:hypothetical protein
MRRILAMAAALTITVAVGSAQAHHGGGGGTFWHRHHHGWGIAGTNASFSGTQNSDGTFTGDLTLTVGHHSPTTQTFHLDGTRVKFAQSVGDGNGDGTVDFSDVQPSDVVVLKAFGGHHHWSGDHSSKARHARAHRSCDSGAGSSSPSDTSTPTVKFAFVFSPPSS